ncbi:HAD family hydrolase [Cochlodiniinecator piscidefendens]|uniref:HAD family hydrolase n=1 Tax=Cochlodiniinecator piscidefendens TaxID=2715756 RepID=UPI001408471A|nr:HAD family hydrolase [Cochlodiniinecator piscidefendens]
MTDIRGLLFDKDGTLFKFAETWSTWAAQFLRGLADGDTEKAQKLGDLIGYDYANLVFDRSSVVIAGTPGEIADALLPALPELSKEELVQRMNSVAETAPVTEATPLKPLLRNFKTRGLKVGVATNDAEAPARANLASVDITDQFDFIAGFDSGYGGKPEIGQMLAFAGQMDLAPSQIAMVGDSAHDLIAGRTAGMATIAVLTGMATEDELAPLADVVLPDIGHIPAWLDRVSGV